MPKRVRNSIFILACMFLFVIAFSTPSFAELVESIVAVVNGDIITQTDLENHIKAGERMHAKTRAFKELEEENRRSMALDQLVDQAILDQQIEKSDIDVTDEEIMRAVNNILSQNGMTMQHLRGEIAKKGLTWSQYQENVKREIKKVKFVNQVISSDVKISDRDLHDYFDKNRASFHGGKQVHIAEIVFPFTGVNSEAEAIELRDKAIRVAREAHANPESFARLAKQHSRGPNADKGGDMGMLNIADLPPSVGEMVRGLPTGGVTPPIPTDNAVVIAKVVAWPKLSADEFEKVRDTIYDRLQNERISDALTAYIQRAKQNAFVEMR
jgi:peptidyl-prolyl cis-trans isomerase SurA